MIHLSYWIRELAGWALVFLGLYIFYWCFLFLAVRPPKIIETSYLTIIGFIVFRGGIHLLKVAVAARVAIQARRDRRNDK